MMTKKLTFHDLSIGDTFRFTTEFEFPFSGIKKGLAKKISKGKYIYPEDTGISEGLKYQVGTVKTTVIKTDQQNKDFILITVIDSLDTTSQT